MKLRYFISKPMGQSYKNCVVQSIHSILDQFILPLVILLNLSGLNLMEGKLTIEQ